MISIRIYFETTHNKLTQAGEFPLRGRRPEQVAFEWWKELKKETFNPRLRRVVINGDQDITELVKQLDSAPLPPDNLPF